MSRTPWEVVRDASAKKQSLLLRAVHGDRSPRFKEEYEECWEAIGENLPRVSISESEPSRRGKILWSPVRLGINKNEGFWPKLNPISRSNTALLMDTALVAKTFEDLESAPRSLNEVESAVLALLVSLGFKDVGDALAFVEAVGSPAPIPSDEEAVIRAKQERLGDIVGCLPSSEEVQGFLSSYIRDERDAWEKAKTLVWEFGQTQVKPLRSMNPTPSAPTAWKSYRKRIAPMYDPSPLHKAFLDLKNDTSATEEERRARSDALNEEMQRFSVAAIQYWKDVLRVIGEKKALEQAYRTETAMLVACQLQEANRVVGDTLKLVSNLRGAFTRLAVMVAEGFTQGGEIETMMANAVNQFFGHLTCRLGFDYYASLRSIIELPRNNPVSAIKYLSSIGLPESHAAAVAEKSKREQIVFAAASLVFMQA